MSKIMTRNDNPNPKHIKKRLIAQRIVGIAFAGLLASAIASSFVDSSIQDDVNILKDEQTKIYETFKASPEFQTEFKTEVQNATEAYISGQISYEEFSKQLEQLNSNDFLQEVFNEKANAKLKQEIAQADEEITYLKENSNRATANKVLVRTVLGCGAIAMASTIPWSIYDYKASWKEVDEEEVENTENTTL